jgi:trk system potassium uptake protein
MKIIVAGAGKLGRRVAEIIKEKHDVVVIDRDEARCRYIAELLDVPVVYGDACSPAILLQAGADHADVLVAATSDDEDNLVLAMLAKTEFKIKSVIGAVRNPRNQWLYNRSWGVDVALDSAGMVAKIIEEEATLRDLVTLLKLRGGEVSVSEVTISEDSKFVGKAIKDLGLPERCVVAAILRGTSILVPSADQEIIAGDEILFIADPSAEILLHDLV